MKHLITLLALCIATGLGHLRAQTVASDITATYNHDSCSTHAFVYQVTTGSTAGAYKIEHSWGDGNVDTFGTYQPYSTFTFLEHYNYAAPGTYTAKAVLLRNNLRIDSATQLVNNGICIAFTGRLYVDQNNNCVYNQGPDYLVNTPLLVKVDSANIPVDTVTSYGHWVYTRPNTGSTMPVAYKFTVLNPPAGLTSTCQTANSITVNYPGASLSNINFGYTCSGTAFDVSGYYQAFMRTSTAGLSHIYGSFSNIGCPSQAGTVTLKVSPKYNINTAGVQPTPASVVGNLISWNYTNLHNYGSQPFFVPITPTMVYTTNDTGCNTLTVNPITGDINPTNNIVSRCDSLRAAYDPNDKTPTPSGNVTAGTTLTYHINFENLGNDTAFNIHILDTLSTTLDPASFQLLQASHPMRVMELRGAGSTRILKFEFPNIRLADKTKPLHNKGFVRFTIKTKTGLSNGTSIPNRAGIYFDFNPVVMTNTAMNKIGTPQSVSVLQAAPVNTIHPNPATDRLTITNADGTITQAVLMSATGQVVRRWNIVAGENTVSIESLPAGFYFVQLHSAVGIQVEKLEKF